MSVVKEIPIIEMTSWLGEYLRGQKTIGESDKILSIRQLDGGWSRDTYLVIAEVMGSEQKFIARVESGGGLTGTPLETEYLIYRDLQEFKLKTPKVFAYEDSGQNPFGGPLFLMDHLEGDAPNLWRWEIHEELKSNWIDSKSLAKDFVSSLAAIHLIDENHAPRSLPRTNYLDLIAKWRLLYAENLIARDPFIEEAFIWLEENSPKPGRQGLVHGDFRLGNLLIQDSRILGIIDWELAHVGDVNYDLGYISLKYVAGKHLYSKTNLLSGVCDREWFFDEYQRLTGDSVDRESVDWWSVLTLAALIVMSMIGFHAFSVGATTDIRRIWSRWAMPGLRQEMTQIAKW